VFLSIFLPFVVILEYSSDLFLCFFEFLLFSTPGTELHTLCVQTCILSARYLRGSARLCAGSASYLRAICAALRGSALDFTSFLVLASTLHVTALTLPARHFCTYVAEILLFSLTPTCLCDVCRCTACLCMFLFGLDAISAFLTAFSTFHEQYIQNLCNTLKLCKHALVHHKT
jgi:hypothetical protein